MNPWQRAELVFRLLRREETGVRLAERDPLIGELTVANRIQKNFNTRPLNADLIELIETSCQERETKVRIEQLLKCLRISFSSWY